MDEAQIVDQFLEFQSKLKRQQLAPPGSNLKLVTQDAGSYDAGSIFEAETTKGGKNYIVFAMVYNGWAYYFHGDRAKKVPEADFKSRISYGDLVYVPREKADIERLALCVLGVNAMLNGLSFEDYLKVAFNYGKGSQVPVIRE
jgi:hypothetical protein